MRDIPDILRRYFRAYQSKNRPAIEELLADDFTFSSPNDDRIDRRSYFEKCWPTSQKARAFTIERLFEKGGEAVVRYRSELSNGAIFRNTELFRFDGNRIAEVDVYFGRTLKEAAGKPG